ncbi:uncharacterized protein LOC144139651 [Haemaphysalis longicornis]
MFNTGTPTGIINALGPIIEGFLGSSLGGISSFLKLGNLSLCGQQNCTNFFKTNVTCNSTITLLLPKIPSTGNASSVIRLSHILLLFVRFGEKVTAFMFPTIRHCASNNYLVKVQ